MAEYAHPVIAVTDQALASMREQGIRHITLNREGFNEVAELVGRDPFEAGALNLAFGGMRRRIAGVEFGSIQYDPTAEYRTALQANGKSSDLRRGDLPRHNPSAAAEAGLLSTWPIPREWTEEELARAAVQALRFPPPLMRNALVVNGSFFAVGAGGGALYAHERGLSVVELTLLGGAAGLAGGALATTVGLTLTSESNRKRLNKEAAKHHPFRIVREPTSASAP